MGKQNDFIVYSDADRTDFVQSIPSIIETMINDGSDLAIEQMTYSERQYTKADIYQYFYGDDATLKQKEDGSKQYNANFLVFRKSEWSVHFVQEWLNGVSDFHLVSSEESVLNNTKDFKKPRHDQSMLSMLLKSRYSQKEKRKKKT